MIWLETGLTSFSLNLADFLISSPSLCLELLILVLLPRNSEEFDTNSLSQVDLAIWSFFLNTFKVSLMCYIVRFFFIKIRVFLFVFENDWSAKKSVFLMRTPFYLCNISPQNQWFTEPIIDLQFEAFISSISYLCFTPPDVATNAS